jgi:hypothetical protein
MDTEELLRLEDEGWRALCTDRGAEFYAEHLTDDAVMILPVGEMDRATALRTIEAAEPWAGYRIDEPEVRGFGPGAAAVVYGVEARRQREEEPYRALMTSVYVEQGGRWRLALHQQTPLLT